MEAPVCTRSWIQNSSSLLWCWSFFCCSSGNIWQSCSRSRALWARTAQWSGVCPGKSSMGDHKNGPNDTTDVQRGRERWLGNACISAHLLLKYKSFSGLKGTCWLYRHFLGLFIVCSVPIVHWITAESAAPLISVVLGHTAKPYPVSFWGRSGLLAHHQLQLSISQQNSQCLFLFNTIIKYLYKGFYLQNPSFLNQEGNLLTV